jgi:hypothetical protein
MYKFPPWLPAEVKEHATQLVNARGLNTLEPLLIRLVTQHEMKSVWERLARETDKPQKLIDYLEYVRLHSTLQGNLTDSIKIPSDKKQRAAFKKIGNGIQNITETLSSLSIERDPQEGWRLLEATLRRTELNEISQESKGLFFKIKELQSNLSVIQQQVSVVSLFKIIGEAAQIAFISPRSKLPIRRDTKRAKRNQLAMDLKKYLQIHFSIESADTLIANTINTAFNTPDGGISSDDVRKLKT